MRPPTSLQNTFITGNTSYAANMNADTACSVSSAITSATLTEVLNISGSGVLTFSMLSGAATSSHKINITIDGIAALNETSGAGISATQGFSQVGFYNNARAHSSEGVVVFDSSLVVQIAGDGSNGVVYHFRRYLT